MTIIEKARVFATEAHKNHTESDKYKTPYIFHLQRVSALVALSGGSEDEIASAWLHDTIEDTDTTLENIEREFGANIAGIVNGLTDLPEWDSLSVMDKKVAQAERISKESESVRRVKLADQISGGELDARNELIPIEKRREKLKGVKKVAEACSGVSKELDNLFNAVYMELDWFLNNANH
jgi:guanosine-3',5'-bis(diphosphate) 3'-pyrophosphohydrolase